MTTSVLERLDTIAKQSLANADRNIRELHLDDAVENLSRAFDAVYLMYFSSNSELRDYSVSQSILGPDAIGALRNLNLDRSVLRTANAEHTDFYKSHGYTWAGLSGDWRAIAGYMRLVDSAKKGNLSNAEGMKKWLADEKESLFKPGCLPKPLLSEEALNTALDYARKKEAGDTQDRQGVIYRLKKRLSSYRLPFNYSSS